MSGPPLAILSGMILASVAVSAGDPSAWQRYPLAVVPFLEPSPAIDGNVERQEWTAAAALGPMKVGPAGIADDTPRQVYLGYDDTHFYVGFTIDRPAGARTPRIPEGTGHIDDWRGGDAVEIHIDANHDAKTYYNFCLYANGAYADGLGSPGVNKFWDADWQQAASMTATGWQGEVAIPFAAIGLAGPPAPDAVVGFDFVDVRRTPAVALAHWSFRGPSWHNYENFGHLKFAGRVPSARFLRAGRAGEQETTAEFELVNTTGQAQQIRAELQMYRRKQGPAGGAKSYYDNLESGISDYDPSAGITNLEGYKGTQVAGVVANTLRFFDPVADGGRISTVVELPAGQRRSLSLLAATGAGEYVVLFDFQTTAPLLQGAASFRIDPPITFELAPYWLYDQIIDVAIDFHRLPVSEVTTIRFELRAAGADRVMISAIEAPDGAGGASVTMSTAELPVGYYRISADLLRADGSVLGSGATEVEKPPPPAWFETTAGRQLKVPEPYTPLQATADGQVEVWNRRYQLGSVLPTSMTANGDELLVAPVRLDLFQGETPLAWTVAQCKMLRQDEARTEFDVRLTNPNARVEGTMWVEFDGLIWYDLRLIPNGELTLDRGELCVEVAAQHAELLGTHKYLFDPVLSKKPLLPTAKDAGAGGVDGKLVAAWLPFTPCVWIGDEHGGVAWYAEAPVDWVVTPKTGAGRMLEVAPATAAQPAFIKAHIIQQPVKLAKPMRLQFGLQASPMRPFPPENDAHVLQWGGPVNSDDAYRTMAEWGGKTVVFHGGWKGDKQNDWGGFPDFPRSPEACRTLKDAVATAHKYGIKILLYTGWGINADGDEWQKFGHELCRKPIEYSGFRTYRQVSGLRGGYIDYMAYSMAELVREFDIDGVLYDSTSNLPPDSNLRIGNGWIDDQGRTRPGYPVLGTRELFKRVYTVFHGERKSGGVIINHPGSIWCINSFSDIHHRGEGWPMRSPSLRDSWNPLEDYRVSYGARPFGLLPLGMNKNFKGLPMRVNNHHAVLLLHGYLCKANGGVLGAAVRDADGNEIMRYGVDQSNHADYGYNDTPQAKIWRARTWLPFDETTVRHHFYEGQTVVRPEHQPLLASAFVSGDGQRALIVVSNLDQGELTATPIQLDLAALGLAADKVQLADAILDQPIALNGDRFTIDIASERYRLLKLWQ